jgi:hypothetical protein
MSKVRRLNAKLADEQHKVTYSDSMISANNENQEEQKAPLL